LKMSASRLKASGSIRVTPANGLSSARIESSTRAIVIERPAVIRTRASGIFCAEEVAETYGNGTGAE
jgi:hypothetical protein